jgi:hypothetical protein
MSELRRHLTTSGENGEDTKLILGTLLAKGEKNE